MSSTINVIKNNIKMPLILGEGVVFGLYFMIAFIEALRTDALNKKKKKEEENSGTEESGNKDE